VRHAAASVGSLLAIAVDRRLGDMRTGELFNCLSRNFGAAIY
jgi:hypothetical protein